ncbi:hypothetical protein IAU59_003610 [Kwoniella sp. CBS 9459]
MPVTHKNRNRNQAKNPYRKPKPAASAGGGDGSRPGPGHKIPSTQERSADALPGLSKIKASIRQTKRLLAKDNLEPGLRVQTQRRLTSLEADLANAEKREVEKKNGAKYHMVKFFDRQKLLRIIKRLTKKVGKSGDESAKSVKAEEELQDARIMLNYVLNFPNTEKYISLFPTSTSHTHTNGTAPTTVPEPESELDSTKLKVPPLLRGGPSRDGSDLGMDKPAQRRLEILRQIEGLMRAGKLSETPEEEVKREGGSRRHDAVAVNVGAGEAANAGAEGGLSDKKGKSKSKGKGGEDKGKEDKVEEDDFFESD